MHQCHEREYFQHFAYTFEFIMSVFIFLSAILEDKDTSGRRKTNAVEYSLNRCVDSSMLIYRAGSRGAKSYNEGENS